MNVHTRYFYNIYEFFIEFYTYISEEVKFMEEMLFEFMLC